MPAHITIAFDNSDDSDDPATLLPVPRPEPKWLRVNVEGERAITQVCASPVGPFILPRANGLTRS